MNFLVTGLDERHEWDANDSLDLTIVKPWLESNWLKIKRYDVWLEAVSFIFQCPYENIKFFFILITIP